MALAILVTNLLTNRCENSRSLLHAVCYVECSVILIHVCMFICCNLDLSVYLFSFK